MKILNIRSIDEVPLNFTGIAIYKDGSCVWHYLGDWHREDGPALVCKRSMNHYWYLNGQRLTMESWFEQLSPEQQLLAIWNLHKWKNPK